MQDWYAGDIGDYGKLGLLRIFGREGLSIGVNWYKTQPLASEISADGRFRHQDGRYRIVLKEAQAARWLGKDELFSVEWLPADVEIVKEIKSILL